MLWVFGSAQVEGFQTAGRRGTHARYVCVKTAILVEVTKGVRHTEIMAWPDPAFALVREEAASIIEIEIDA